ncbi:Lipoxygenase 6, chloroplastic [Ananas comosus]|uniref:Lipoxygenase 6, chloroplastic n=1 Tax=Ananas comosus TaxID=4615 RepID=A0A199UYY0_ANACO|nr:Lipoxygenase 6, chloroplastic [Ananas comosus]
MLSKSTLPLHRLPPPPRPSAVLSGAGAASARLQRWRQRGLPIATVRAVISGDDRSSAAAPAAGDRERRRPPAAAPGEEGIAVRAVVTVRKKEKERLAEKAEGRWEHFINAIGQGIVLQIVGDELDPAPRGQGWAHVLN